ncbi:unnamed protein product [Mesocestoides corti]|uniref:Uncharacterized protein n=1 Tax=Mesocestoides corti TaxID=53468 RepID=A0A0R3U8U5_MESCO|nr:unnamed protein product [Mesocestoides corti]
MPGCVVGVGVANFRAVYRSSSRTALNPHRVVYRSPSRTPLNPHRVVYRLPRRASVNSHLVVQITNPISIGHKLIAHKPDESCSDASYECPRAVGVESTRVFAVTNDFACSSQNETSSGDLYTRGFKETASL